MTPPTNALFTSDLWQRALEKYASDTNLSVKLFDTEENVVFGPVNSTPLFKLFDERGYDPDIFAECARRCLGQTNGRPAVIVSEIYGLAVVGTSLAVEGKVVGAAVGGYAFIDFSQPSEVQRLAKDAGIQFEQLWQVAREQKPVPKHRLMLNGELLQVLGDALLRENYRTRQYEDVVLKLQQTAREKDAAHRELQRSEEDLREHERRLTQELRAAQQLQSASTILILGGDTDALYQKIVEAAVVIMQSDFASIQRLYPERGNGGELRLLSFHGFDPDAAKFWEWVRTDSNCSCGVALRTGQRVVVSDVRNCDFMAGTDDQAAYLQAGIHAVQSTPLLSRAGHVLGMLTTHWREPHSVSEHQLRQFDILARQAADLLERNQAEETLRTSEERYRTLFDLGPVAVYSCDASGVIQNFNRRAVELWGRTPEVGDTDERFCGSFKLFRPDGSFMPHEQCPMADVVSCKVSEVHDAEVFIQRSDGSGVTVIVNIRPLKNERGEVTGAVNCFYDITERKQAEKAITESEERFRMLADNMAQLAWTCDLLGNVTWYNERWYDYTGTTFEEMKDWGWKKVQHPDHVDRVVQGVQRSRESGEVWEDIFPLRSRGGDYRWFLSRAVPIRDEQGKIRRWFGTNTDITERREAEQALREAGERFRFLAESMPQKVFTAKPNGGVDYFNPQWTEFTGLSFEQIRNWGWTQFIHPDDLEENLRRWRNSVATGEPFYLEHRIRNADGGYHWHFSRVIAMHDASGRIVMWIGSSADIQPIKDQEERLRKAEKMAAAGQLAASLAHEINNPLSSVTNALYLLENHKDLDESARPFVITAATELSRVSRIVKQSLSYYRVGSVPRDLDLGKIVNESLQIFSPKLQRASVDVKSRIHNSTQIVGFADELRQVIDNLLINAMEAMPNGGCLSVSLRDSCDWKDHHDHRRGIRLTMADTGCGIPRDQQRRIFEPFFTTKAEKGTGLGLWVLHGIVSKHQGFLTVRSSDAEGRSGTIISVFLPSHVRTPVKPKHSESAA